jgi:hypothetical protein
MFNTEYVVDDIPNGKPRNVATFSFFADIVRDVKLNSLLEATSSVAIISRAFERVEIIMSALCERKGK